MTNPDVFSQSSFEVILTAIQEEVEGVKSFLIRSANGEPIPYRAGQFLTFAVDTPGGEERRSYSFFTSPETDAQPGFAVRRIDNGLLSRWLIDHAQVGDRLTCTGISGLFTLPSEPGPLRRLVLFAAGIGITPVYSLLKSALVLHPHLEITLLYSNRSEALAVFRGALSTLEAQYARRLRIEWLYSDHKDLLRTRITRPYLSTFLKQLGGAPDETLFYICGPTDYMWLIALLLEEHGIPDAAIRRELFVTQRPPLTQTPPDTTEHQVTIHSGGRTVSFRAAFPDTILTAAKKQGINLPYSCQAGRCSGCIAQCEQGTVWMSYNEVLTEGDIEKGIVLTCTGYPVNGDVTLRYGLPGIENSITPFS